MILPHPSLIMAVEKKKGSDEKEGKDGGSGGQKAKPAVAQGLLLPVGLEDANIGFAQATEKKKEADTGDKTEMTLKEKETAKMDEFLKQI